MELTLHWFWLVNVVLAVAVLFSLYKGAVTAKKSKKPWNKWTTISFILITFHVFAPIKLDVDTRSVQQISNKAIAEVRKTIPSKVEDSSFKQNSQITGITEKDIK